MNKQCKFHSNNDTCNGKPCRKCIPFITFKATIILSAGLLIGTSGLMLVEGNSATDLVVGSGINTNTQWILHMDEINSSLADIKIDVAHIKNRIGLDK